MRRIIICFILLNINLLAYATAPTQYSIAPMLKGIMPAVVNVKVRTKLPLNFLSKGRVSKSPQHAQVFEDLGSGVIINAKQGYILTNAHVVKHASSITVTLNDSRHFTATLVGADTASDIAVLKIKAKHLHSIPLGNSDKLQVGDFVAAIGSPFGLNQTVTSGIVSALQRNDLNIEDYENFIQTDAAINPGNSGGALVTYKGKLIGINTAIISQGNGNIGIGFAIPINMAHSIMQQLIKYGKVRRGLLGVFAQPLTSDLMTAFHLPDGLKGSIITAVSPGSPAAKAGLQVGDVILKINDQTVKNPFDIRNVIGLLRVGSHVSLTILRNGKTITKDATIFNSKTQMKELRRHQPFLSGISFGDVNNIQSVAHGKIDGGVQVLKIEPNSPAEQAGLMTGDIIISANKQPVTNIASLIKAAKTNKHSLLLNVIRGPGALFIVIK